MIERMLKYNFVLTPDLGACFLDEIASLGVIDVVRSRTAEDSGTSALMSEMEKLRSRISILRSGNPDADPEYSSLTAQRASASKRLAERAVWGDFDRDEILQLEKKGLSFHWYAVPVKKFDPSWENQYCTAIASVQDGTVYFTVVAAGDAEPAIPADSVGMPEGDLRTMEEELSSMDLRLGKRKLELDEERLTLPQLEKELTGLGHKLEIHLAEESSESAVDGCITVYRGFAPADKADTIAAALDAKGVFYTCESARVEDNPPIKLRNNAFCRQFEVLTGMYGLPVYNEFDPTVFLSIFFLLFFSMCMGDAGYGILLIVIGLMLKGKEGGLAKLWSLIVTLGAGTVVVGLIMGGFFGVDLSVQEWVPASVRKLMLTGDVQMGSGSYSLQMVLSLLIGVVHICLAMLMKAVWAVKREGFLSSLSSLGWTLLIVGGVVAMGAWLAGMLSEDAMRLTIIGIAGVSALGIFIFNKWGRNPLVNIGSGLWDTYSMASGLMGDVLSYIRLYALGLSGGMLGSTFNQIALMVRGDDPSWQWVPFVLIIIVGHALNLAMSCLGAFVHPLRLNFVEFFKNSDYQGRGVGYKPLQK